MILIGIIIADTLAGILPNVGRNAIVNVSEIVCYDVIKDAILHRGLMEDNVPCHFAAAVVAGKTPLHNGIERS